MRGPSARTLWRSATTIRFTSSIADGRDAPGAPRGFLRVPASAPSKPAVRVAPQKRARKRGRRGKRRGEERRAREGTRAGTSWASARRVPLCLLCIRTPGVRAPGRRAAKPPLVLRARGLELVCPVVVARRCRLRRLSRVQHPRMAELPLEVSLALLHGVLSSHALLILLMPAARSERPFQVLDRRAPGSCGRGGRAARHVG